MDNISEYIIMYIAFGGLTTMVYNIHFDIDNSKLLASLFIAFVWPYSLFKMWKNPIPPKNEKKKT